MKALDHILGYAFEQRASDIHFEPKRDLTLVRLRIDGVLHDVHVIPKIVYEAVVSRIKLLCGANLAEKRRPQDGRIKREQGGREVELRVSTMPTAFGEKAVLRIFDPDILLKTIDELGLSPHDLPKFNDFIARRPASSWSPARPAAARPRRSTRCSSTSRSPRSTSSRSRTRSRWCSRTSTRCRCGR